MSHFLWCPLFVSLLVICGACSSVSPQGEQRTNPSLLSGDLWFAGLDHAGNLRPSQAIVDGSPWTGWPETVTDADDLPENLDANKDVLPGT